MGDDGSGQFRTGQQGSARVKKGPDQSGQFRTGPKRIGQISMSQEGSGQEEENTSN